MTIIAFWPVGSYEFERHTLDNVSDLDAFRILWHKKDDLDVRFFDMTQRKSGDFYYMGTPDDFEEDYNDEVFDGGWWCKVMHLDDAAAMEIITRTVPFTPKDTEFFSIIDGMVHIEAYLWKDDEGGWRLTECTFCVCPVKEFIEGYAERGQEFVDEIESEVTQYETDGLSEDDARDIILHYLDNAKPLNYKEITENTPEGNYRTK